MTLLSNQDKTHTSSRFSNYLPHHIYPRRGYSCLYVRILDLCTPIPPNTDQVVWIFLSELEGNILVKPELDHCLGQAQLTSGPQNRVDLCYRQYKHACFHRISQVPLNKLSIRIADHESNLLDNVANRATSVTLEIMDEIETGEQFEIAGFSNPTAENNPFPYNRANDFTVPLPYEVNLGEGWEVALKSMTFPAQMVNTKYWLRVREQLFYLDVSVVTSRREAVALLKETLESSNYGEGFDVRLQNATTHAGYVLHVKRKDDTTDFPEDFVMGVSEAVVKLLNPASNLSTMLFTVGAGQTLPLNVAPDLDRHTVPKEISPIGFIHCDTVASSVLGGELQPLLHTIPMGRFVFSQNVSFYEPENLVYRDTINRKFNSVNIKLFDVHGEKYPIQPHRDQDNIIITLKFRRRQNLASYAL